MVHQQQIESQELHRVHHLIWILCWIHPQHQTVLLLWIVRLRSMKRMDLMRYTLKIQLNPSQMIVSIDHIGVCSQIEMQLFSIKRWFSRMSSIYFLVQRLNRSSLVTFFPTVNQLYGVAQRLFGIHLHVIQCCPNIRTIRENQFA